MSREESTSLGFAVVGDDGAGYAKGMRDAEGIVYRVASVHAEITWIVGGFDVLCSHTC